MTGILDPTLRGLSNCGCCAGSEGTTPAGISNRPGLPAIVYRVGTHGQFVQVMLAALSSARYPTLADLRTRERDDFAVALCDAWAVIADVLTFYQERLANEAFLRCATERVSLLHLARLIGYELSPGVAADTSLAFTLEDAPGSPRRTTLDIGVKVQSVPGPGETAQTFETVEEIEARVEWNALRPRTKTFVLPQFDDSWLFLQGTATNLKPGDLLLLVGDEKQNDPASNRWDFRRLTGVEPDYESNFTRVSWTPPLGSVAPIQLPSANPRVYALRQRASLFGHNAPPWKALPLPLREEGGAYAGEEDNWNDQPFAADAAAMNLDAVYGQIVAGGWVVLTTTVPMVDAEVFYVLGVSEESKSEYSLTGKTTRLEISGTGIEKFAPKFTAVYAQSEELELAATPVTDPVWGTEVELDHPVSDLVPGRMVAIFGKLAKVRVMPAGHQLSMSDADGQLLGHLRRGEVLDVLDGPPTPAGGGGQTWHLENADGVAGFVTAAEGQLTRAVPTRDDPAVMELAVLEQVDPPGPGPQTLLFTKRLQHAYDRFSTRINANVLAATHGETVKEILGGAVGGKTYQRFTLKQKPLTFTSAANARGIASSLEVRINDVRWQEVSSFYGRGPRDRVYITRTGDDAKTTVLFGDGSAGAIPPGGQDHVRAEFRKGIGKGGMLKAGQLSLLLTRPLGVKDVINPEDATGAKDPETLAGARRNAPLTVLTLDRVVSLLDYENFALAFAGVGKALATWTWHRGERGVYLTVAGEDGAALPPTGKTYQSLVEALRQAGDPLVPIIVASYRPAFFRFTAQLKIDADFLAEKVNADAEQALRDRFSFDTRAFGQPVMLSEVITAVQAVPGVIAVDVDAFYRSESSSAEQPPVRLLAELPVADEGGDAPAAELLLVDPNPLSFGDMP